MVGVLGVWGRPPRVGDDPPEVDNEPSDSRGMLRRDEEALRAVWLPLGDTAGSACCSPEPSTN